MFMSLSHREETVGQSWIHEESKQTEVVVDGVVPHESGVKCRQDHLRRLSS